MASEGFTRRMIPFTSDFSRMEKLRVGEFTSSQMVHIIRAFSKEIKLSVRMGSIYLKSLRTEEVSGTMYSMEMGSKLGSIIHLMVTIRTELRHQE